jgi:hypothetical protein
MVYQSNITNVLIILLNAVYSVFIYLTRSRLRIFQIAEILDLEEFSLVL